MPAPKWYDIFTAAAGAECTRVGLYDDIGSGDKTANDFTNALNAVKTPNIDLHVNSNGGEIFDGFACYNAIKAHPGHVTTHIDGVAASVASLIAMAGNKVVMAKNAFMMIHSGWGKFAGDAVELHKQADVLDKLSNSIAQAYADKTGKPVDVIRAAMDAETWFSAEEAKAYGLIDEIEGEGDEKQMASSALLAVAKYQKVPPALRTFAASAARNSLKTKGAKMEKLVCREGKWFVGDTEVDATEALASVKPVDGMEQAVAKARDEGMKAERDYRGMFNTVIGTAGLDTAGATEFEKEFYGRSETDLKFLASHAIGKRAKAIGEAAPGNGEDEAVTDAAEKDLEAAAVKRFASSPDTRLLFGVSPSMKETHPAYVEAVNQYVASEKKWAKDRTSGKDRVAK